MKAAKLILIAMFLSGAFSAFACNSPNKPDMTITQPDVSPYMRLAQNLGRPAPAPTTDGAATR